MYNDSVDLHLLYKNSDIHPCNGCSILDISKPFHCHKDYERLFLSKPIDVLFLKDSFFYDGWQKVIFNKYEQDKFNELVLPLLNGITYGLSVAVKCPSVKETEMGAKNMKICRTYLDETVKAFNPKLIIPLGNLSMKMLLKRSGIKKHHGSEFTYNAIPVVPTFGLANLFFDANLSEVIQQDIRLALNKFIYKNVQQLELDWEIISDSNRLQDLLNLIVSQNVAVDIETTGLNHLKDKVLSIALSFEVNGKIKNVCIPVFHKESKLSSEELGKCLQLVNKVLSDTKIKKILHNSKFDSKFLFLIGVNLVNVWDTKTMYHLIDEYGEKSLMALVKKYMPEGLNAL